MQLSNNSQISKIQKYDTNQYNSNYNNNTNDQFDQDQHLLLQSKETDKYVPLVYRTDILPPQYDKSKNNLDLPLSESSHDSDYMDDDVYEYLLEIKQKKGRTKPFFQEIDMGSSVETLRKFNIQLHKENIQKEKNTKQNEQKQNNKSEKIETGISQEDYDNFNIDFLDTKQVENNNNSKKQRPYKPHVKYEEDEIPHYSLFKLQQFLVYKFINEYKNDKLEKLKTIFVIYKHPHLQLSMTKIFDFFLPVYIDIEDKSDIQEEFQDWKDCLIKRMCLRNEDAKYVHLSNGLPVKHFGQIPIESRVLIIGPSQQLEFWKDFQRQHKIQIKPQLQLDYIKDLNDCTSKDQIFSNLISITQVEKKLRQKEQQRLIQKQKLQEKRLLKQYSVENIMGREETEETIDLDIDVEDQEQNQDLKFKKLRQKKKISLETAQKISIEEQNKIKQQTEEKIKEIEDMINNKKNLFRKYNKSSMDGNRYSDSGYYSVVNKLKSQEKFQTQSQGRKRQQLKPIKSQDFAFKDVPRYQLKNQLQLNQVESPKNLLLMYNKYTGLLKQNLMQENDITTSNQSQKRFNFGAIVKNFNSVRMKIIQSSLPSVIQGNQKEKDTIKEQFQSIQEQGQTFKQRESILHSSRDGQSPQYMQSNYQPTSTFNQTIGKKVKKKNYPPKMQLNDFFDYNYYQQRRLIKQQNLQPYL